MTDAMIRPDPDPEAHYWVRTGDDDAPMYLMRMSLTGVHIWNARADAWVATSGASIPAPGSSDHDTVNPADVPAMQAVLRNDAT